MTIQDSVLVIGIVLQLLGLAVVIFQLSQVNTSIRVSSQASLYQQSSEIRSLLVQYPHLRKYIFDGAEVDRDSAEYSSARTVAEMSLNYLEHLIIQKDVLRKEDWEAWSEFVAKSIAASPLMQDILKEVPDLYTKELVDVYRTHRIQRESTGTVFGKPSDAPESASQGVSKIEGQPRGPDDP